MSLLGRRIASPCRRSSDARARSCKAVTSRDGFFSQFVNNFLKKKKNSACVSLVDLEVLQQSCRRMQCDTPSSDVLDAWNLSMLFLHTFLLAEYVAPAPAVIYAVFATVVEYVTPAPSVAYAAPMTTMTVVTQPVSTVSIASAKVLPRRTVGCLCGNPD